MCNILENVVIGSQGPSQGNVGCWLLLSQSVADCGWW
ncbi:hypothetical protein SLEP1_g49398 [Rubroshorea leprosula]|uniref:Uncharacterized protein n=1 Tax=Rubroshorea leprosula TaxID=152421 RepID=A0AAV5LWP2_9ROSI|nr:hypothetical protein SLEP1_g49398 [Rubroshorea leprosula]